MSGPSFDPGTVLPLTRAPSRAGPGTGGLPAAIALPLAGLLSREMQRADDLAAFDRALRTHGYCLRIGSDGVELHSWPTGGKICRLEGLRHPRREHHPSPGRITGRTVTAKAPR